MSAVIDRAETERLANLEQFLRSSRTHTLVGTTLVLAGVSLLLAMLDDISICAAVLPLAGAFALYWQSTESPLASAPIVLMATALVVSLSPLFTDIHPFSFAVAMIGLTVAMSGLINIGQGAVTRHACKRMQREYGAAESTSTHVVARTSSLPTANRRR